MPPHREIHPDFLFYLREKDQDLIDLFADLRQFLLEIYPDSNELLYHTHALTNVFSLTPKLGDAFCHIPVYTKHLNLGFNKGAALDDPDQLLQGTGKWIRHIPVSSPEDYRNEPTEKLVRAAIALGEEDLDKPGPIKGKVISKIKR
jgi:hypothetical protein